MKNIYLSDKEIAFIKHFDMYDHEVILHLEERERRCLDNVPFYEYMRMKEPERLKQEAKERIIRNFFTKPSVCFTDVLSSIASLETQSLELRLEMIKQAVEFQQELKYWK